jgi:glucose-1-phosphate thymidylyltransferase
MIGQYLSEGNRPDAPGNFPAWLCGRKRLMAYAFDGECYDIGTVESYEHVCGLF